MTRMVAKNPRNEHTFEPVPSHRDGVQSLQVLFAFCFLLMLQVQQQTRMKDPAKMGLKGKSADPKLLD